MLSPNDYSTLLPGDSTLVKILQRGGRFRIPETKEDPHAQIEEFATQLFDTMKQKVSKQHTAGSWTRPWLDKFKAVLTEKCNELKAHLQDYPDSIQAHNTIAAEYQLSPAEKRTLKELRKSFAIIPTDKATDIFAIVCKNWLLKAIRTDLSNSQFYELLTTIQPSQLSGSLVQQLSIWGMGKSDTLGPYTTYVKLHKPIPTCRFIVASNGSYNEELSILLTRFLTDVQLFAHDHWATHFIHTLGFSANILPHLKSWILGSAQDIIPLIEHFNRHRAWHFDNSIPLSVTTADFERLYTHIPHSDLKDDAPPSHTAV
jgi:hypothetical protein